MRRLLLSALLATLLVLAGSSTASATITLTNSGTTLSITGTGDDTTYVGFSTTYVPGGAVTVRNSTGVVNNSGGACLEEVIPALGTCFPCPASTTTLQATYGAGSDRVVMEGVCIPTENVALGEGANAFEQASTDGCPASTVANVTAGGGQDELYGGSATTPSAGAAASPTPPASP